MNLERNDDKVMDIVIQKNGGINVMFDRNSSMMYRKNLGCRAIMKQARSYGDVVHSMRKGRTDV